MQYLANQHSSSHQSSSQCNARGELQHLLTIEGLSRELILSILDRAESFLSISDRSVKTVPLLRGKTVVNLFFENSTRTRTTFELAAKRLSADVLNINIQTSATAKGESLLDTLKNIEAMAADMFVVRHAQSGAAQFIAEQVAPHIAVINAGDGWHAHPTQALLDMFTIRYFKQDFSQLKVAIVGDILHSRVARSQIQALSILGVPDIRVVAPLTLLPQAIHALPVQVYSDLLTGIEGVDVVILLRLQKERMQAAYLPTGAEFFHTYGVTVDKLKKAAPEAIVMHPGPMNRGVEIESAVADGPQSVILKQVYFGLAVRMAVLAMTVASRSHAVV